MATKKKTTVVETKTVEPEVQEVQVKSGSRSVETPQDTSQEQKKGLDLRNNSLSREIASKQPMLVSGTNIKTINGQSVLGSGNLEVDRHFKGWYDSASNLPADPVVGDYAYVKGAEATDPAAIYECTTAGTWSDSGRTADTSNVQTFASGEEVNEVHIVNDFTTGGTENVLSAEQGKKIGEEILVRENEPIAPSLIYGRRIHSDGVVKESTSGGGKAYNIAYFAARQTDWTLHIKTISNNNGTITTFSSSGAIALVDSLDEIEVGDTVTGIIVNSTASGYKYDDDFVIPAGKIIVISEYNYSASYYNYYDVQRNPKVRNLSGLDSLDKDNVVTAINDIANIAIKRQFTEITDFDSMTTTSLIRNVVNTSSGMGFKAAYFVAPNDNDLHIRIAANMTSTIISGSSGEVCVVDNISEVVNGARLAPIFEGYPEQTAYQMDIIVKVPRGKTLVVFQVNDYFHYYNVEETINTDNLYTDEKVRLYPTKIYGRTLNQNNVIKESTAGGGTAFNIAYFAARSAQWEAEIVANDINGSVMTGAIALVDSVNDLDIDDVVTDILVPSHPSSTTYSMDEKVLVPANKILVVFEMYYGSKEFDYYDITEKVRLVDYICDKIDEVSNPDYVTENPLDIIKETPGYTSIFRKMGIIGGSMASGSHHVSPSLTGTKYEYSPLQFMARLCGSEGYNFSYGGCSARAWVANTERGGASDLFVNNKCQMYIVQLGNNDKVYHNEHPEYVLGNITDLDGNDGFYLDTFYGNMGHILQRIREVSPHSFVFLSTFYRFYGSIENSDFDYNQAIRNIVDYYTQNDGENRPEGDGLHYYLMDYYKYGKSYSYFNKGIHEGTVLGSHLVGTGYLLTAYQYCTYIDWIIKNNMSDFNDVAFVGTDDYYE